MSFIQEIIENYKLKAGETDRLLNAKEMTIRLGALRWTASDTLRRYGHIETPNEEQETGLNNLRELTQLNFKEFVVNQDYRAYVMASLDYFDSSSNRVANELSTEFIAAVQNSTVLTSCVSRLHKYADILDNPHTAISKTQQMEFNAVIQEEARQQSAEARYERSTNKPGMIRH